jgi:shikimate kinase
VTGKTLILIGHRGVGKTTLGANLSLDLGITHIDTDFLIQDRFEGLPLRQIFLTLGEIAFRAEETKIINSLIPLSAKIISIGGGALEDRQNRIHLQTIGTCCWIKESFEEAYRRFMQNPIPLMKEEEISAKLMKRHSCFKNLASYSLLKAPFEEMLKQLKDIYIEL